MWLISIGGPTVEALKCKVRSRAMDQGTRNCSRVPTLRRLTSNGNQYQIITFMDHKAQFHFFKKETLDRVFLKYLN